MPTAGRRRISASPGERTGRCTCSGRDARGHRSRRSSTRRSRRPEGSAGRRRCWRGGTSVQPPAAAAGRDGSIHVLISGQKVNSNTDPYSGLNEAVGPGSWKLGPRAFGNFQLTVSSAADVSTAMLPGGDLVSAWRSATTMLFQRGVDSSVQPQVITPANDLVELPCDRRGREDRRGRRRLRQRQDPLRLLPPSPAEPRRPEGHARSEERRPLAHGPDRRRHLHRLQPGRQEGLAASLRSAAPVRAGAEGGSGARRPGSPPGRRAGCGSSTATRSRRS